MKWIPPKTNWKIQRDEKGNYQGDYFEIEDYQRICNNLEYLRIQMKKLGYPIQEIRFPVVAKTDFCTAEMIGAIEEGVQALAVGVFCDMVEPRKQWIANGSAPMAQDLNRFERTTNTVYRLILQQQMALPKLAIRLGGGRF